jgi:hypothetical protein
VAPASPATGSWTCLWPPPPPRRAGSPIETWPTSGLTGELAQILPLPSHFEAAIASVDEDEVAAKIVCDQDPDTHLERLREYDDAGYDRVTVQQVGLDQDRFFDFYETRVLSQLAVA